MISGLPALSGRARRPAAEDAGRGTQAETLGRAESEMEAGAEMTTLTIRRKALAKQDQVP